MPSLWSAYWKILTLAAAPFEAVKEARDGLWFALRLFLLVALIAGLADLAAIPDAVAQPTLAERVDGLARRVEESIPMAPWIFTKPLEELVAAIDRAVTQIEAFEPPLGERPSRLLRAVGAWLEPPLNLLARWLGLAVLTWLVARLAGGDGSPRAHFSLVLLSGAPLAFYLVHDLLGGVFASGAAMTYLGWVFKLVIWVWCALILIRALSVAHSFPADRAAAVLVAAALLSLVPTILMAALAISLLYALF